MMWSDGAGPTQPWGRINHLLNGVFAETKNNWNGNWGGYKNADADKLINEIPTLTDAAEIKATYTELVKDLPDRRSFLHPDVSSAIFPHCERECLDELPARR